MRLKQAVWRPLAAAAPAVPPFDELVRTHQGRVRAFLSRLCQSDAVAEDIAQETFLKARKGLKSYRGEGSLASWLLRIAYREFLAQRRKRGVADVLTDNVDDAGDDDRGRLQPDRTMERDVRRALRLLSDDERVAVAACFFEDLTHEEAAAALEIPLGTLKSHVARAKEKLRAPLAAYASASSSSSASSSEVRHER